MSRTSLTTAEADFESLKARRIVTIDLERADLNPDRDDFEAFLKARVAEIITAPTTDPWRDLWKCLLVEADRRFAWRPSPLPVREVSLKASTDATARHATRLLAMVHELHKAGYQRIRVLPYLAPSGTWWRCEITPSDNIADDGFMPRPGGNADSLVARYSSSEGADYFQWPGASQMSARELAARFLTEFPAIAERGQGRDWLYAGWLTDVLGHAERGKTEDLLYLIADWDLDPSVIRDWQPPPPIRD